jgi:hypothetical protein
MAHPRVRRALHVTLRDDRLRERFVALRRDGLRVEDAVLVLTGPHEDERGAAYYLSEERVRAIVYQKGQRPSEHRLDEQRPLG